MDLRGGKPAAAAAVPEGQAQPCCAIAVWGEASSPHQQARPGPSCGPTGPNDDHGRDAVLLALATGELFGVCETDNGVRLQQPEGTLPTLWYQVIDALAEGPCCIDGTELGWLRDSPVRTYSGATVQPSLLVTVCTATDSISLNADGTVTYDEQVCEEGSWCQDDPDLLQPGDVLVPNPMAGSVDQVIQAMDAAFP